MNLPHLFTISILAFTTLLALPAAGAVDHEARAAEVMESIQKDFWTQQSGLYSTKIGSKEPDMMWGNGVMFTALAGAARHDKKYESVMKQFFTAMDAYWDLRAKIPGYEPVPTQGGNDKYYDDNAWMVLTFLEAYEMTGDLSYFTRAKETLDFVVSGWDEQIGGGIWWHEEHKSDTKNTCVNAPAALACFRLARLLKGEEAERWNKLGEKITVWTVKTFQASNGLFSDSITVSTGEVNRDQLTYNAGLMIRVFLSLYARTNERFYLKEALRIGDAADNLLSHETGGYRDHPKFAHLMVEADLELYRVSKRRRYLTRALKTTDAHYEEWKKSPSPDLITQASLARELWLLVDHRTRVGKEFWEEADQIPAK